MKTLSVALALTLAVHCGAAGSPVDQEIARLEQSLAALEKADLPNETRDRIAADKTALERAKRATSPEYRLYRLRDAFVGIETLTYLAKEPAARKSAEAFQKAWDAEKPRIEAKSPTPRGTLLERALIESATTRAERLFHASLPYSKVSSLWSGLYYLGEAHANLRFRDFVRSIASDSDEKSPGKASVAAMIASLDTSTVAFFGNDVSNQKLVAVSARLKEAHELLDASRVDGAALMAVEARTAFSRRGGPKGTYPQNAAAHGGSIANMLEAWSADEEPPMRDALRDEVRPFYGALYLAPPAKEANARTQVKVTLVRWPYT